MNLARQTMPLCSVYDVSMTCNSVHSNPTMVHRKSEGKYDHRYYTRDV